MRSPPSQPCNACASPPVMSQPRKLLGSRVHAGAVEVPVSTMPSVHSCTMLPVMGVPPAAPHVVTAPRVETCPQVGSLWVCGPNGCAIRSHPSFDKNRRTQHMLQGGEKFRVSEEVPADVGGALFLRLADGRGWVFDRKPFRLFGNNFGMICARVAESEPPCERQTVPNSVEAGGSADQHSMSFAAPSSIGGPCLSDASGHDMHRNPESLEALGSSLSRAASIVLELAVLSRCGSLADTSWIDAAAAVDHVFESARYCGLLAHCKFMGKHPEKQNFGMREDTPEIRAGIRRGDVGETALVVSSVMDSEKMCMTPAGDLNLATRKVLTSPGTSAHPAGIAQEPQVASSGLQLACSSMSGTSALNRQACPSTPPSQSWGVPASNSSSSNLAHIGQGDGSAYPSDGAVYPAMVPTTDPAPLPIHTSHTDAAAAGQAGTRVLYLPEHMIGKRIVVETKDPGWYLVDGSQLPSGHAIGYRNSRQPDDLSDACAEFGSIVNGLLENGWLEVHVLMQDLQTAGPEPLHGVSNMHSADPSARDSDFGNAWDVFDKGKDTKGKGGYDMVAGSPDSLQGSTCVCSSFQVGSLDDFGKGLSWDMFGKDKGDKNMAFDCSKNGSVDSFGKGGAFDGLSIGSYNSIGKEPFPDAFGMANGMKGKPSKEFQPAAWGTQMSGVLPGQDVAPGPPAEEFHSAPWGTRIFGAKPTRDATHSPSKEEFQPAQWGTRTYGAQQPAQPAEDVTSGLPKGEFASAPLATSATGTKRIF